MGIFCGSCGQPPRCVRAAPSDVCAFFRRFCFDFRHFPAASPLCSLMDRRLEPCYLPDPLLSSPSTSPTTLPSTTQKNTHLRPLNASFTHRIQRLKWTKGAKRAALPTEAERASKIPRGGSSPTWGINPHPAQLPRPHSLRGKAGKKRTFPGVKNTEQKQQMSGDAAGRRGVFPPNIHTRTPPSTTTTPLPPRSATRTRRTPGLPRLPNPPKLHRPMDLPGRKRAEKSNQLFKSTVPRALPLLSVFFFSSHQT